jgi:hypothetical protein
MSSTIRRASMTRSQLAALARNDLRVAYLLAAHAGVEPRIYLYRRGHLEVSPLAGDPLRHRTARGLAPVDYIPLLIAAGSVQIIALAFAGTRSSDTCTQAMLFLHVLDARCHESWETTINQSADGTQTLDRWATASPDTLSDRATRAIQTALIA